MSIELEQFRLIANDEAGISTDFLANIDMIDAPLCALTAQHLLNGTFKTYGDAAEGFIVVPKT